MNLGHYSAGVIILLYTGLSRPILWNKNFRSLCVSAGWMYKLSIVYLYLFNEHLIIHMILYYVDYTYDTLLCKVIRCFTFVIPFCCVSHRSHAIYSSYCVISFFETPLNLTISFVYIFSRSLKERISSELNGYFFVWERTYINIWWRWLEAEILRDVLWRQGQVIYYLLI